MTLFQAVILGLIQGVTEFLPVSSSGHLVIAQSLMGFDTPPILFDTIVHAGTLFAIFIYFRQRLLHLSKQMMIFAIIGTIPAAFAGLFLDNYIETVFSSLTFVSLGLFITSAFLLSTRLIKFPKKTPISTKSSILTGLFQAFAIWPGVSRSGSSVAAGLLQGQTKHEAFFFSFLLAIPAILGALVLQITDIPSDQILLSAPNILGFIIAAASGLLAIRLLEVVISQLKLHLFAFYTLMLAIAVLFI